MICALATPVFQSIASSSAPVIFIGKPSSRSSSIRAPIFRRGSATRFIGRLLTLESPVSRAWIGCPAMMPDIRRAVVPLLPQSRSLAGDRIPLSPVPRT